MPETAPKILFDRTQPITEEKLFGNPISEFIDSVTWEGVSQKLNWINTIDSTELISINDEDLGIGNVSRINVSTRPTPSFHSLEGGIA